MKQFSTALKFSLREQLSNKFALGLLVVFVPIWYWVVGSITPSDPVPFKFQPTNSMLYVNGHNLVLISSGLSVLAMIVGFMFFHSARLSLAFDKRLTRAGLNRTLFMLAKCTALLAVTAVIALYVVAVLLVFWHGPRNIVVIWAGYWLVSLSYAGLGLLLGVLVNSELAGFFTIIMLAMMDTFLQNPVDNPAANKSFLHDFPSYAATQLCTAGGFTHTVPAGLVVLGAIWLAGFLLPALVAFYLRTRRKSSLWVKATHIV